MERATASARTPSFSHLKNTHPGCFGVPEVSRSTVRVQSSHCMSGIGKPASRCASAEPGRRPVETLPANRRRRLEVELVPACGAGALPGLCGVLPDQSMAWRSHRWPETPNPAAATNNRRSATFRAAEAGASGGQSRACGGPPA